MKLETKELRIGNLIYDDFNEVHRVERIESNDFNTYNGDGDAKVIFSKIIGKKGFYQCDEVSPIPLTEKWLLTFNSKKIISEYPNSYSLNFFNIVYFKNDSRVLINGIAIVTVKYVHELQNLYFALTGEELELK